VRLQNVITGEEISPLVNINQLKTAKDRRAIFNKYRAERNQPAAAAESATIERVTTPLEPTHQIADDGRATAAEPSSEIPGRDVLTQADERMVDVLDRSTPTARQPYTEPTINTSDVLSNDMHPVADPTIDPAHTEVSPSTADNAQTTAPTIRRILRRQLVQRKWQYKVEFEPSGDSAWLPAESIPFQMLYDYNATAAKQRQQRRQRQRRATDQR
jgi:hypothetical protein